MKKGYDEMSKLSTFEERFNYLKIDNKQIGIPTFNGGRYLNQAVYKSKKFSQSRDKVIIRDNGCDLGMLDRPINGPIYVHHINAITKEMVLNDDPAVYDPNNLVCTSFRTHEAIHYGSIETTENISFIERAPNDTKEW